MILQIPCYYRVLFLYAIVSWHRQSRLESENEKQIHIWVHITWFVARAKQRQHRRCTKVSGLHNPYHVQWIEGLPFAETVHHMGRSITTASPPGVRSWRSDVEPVVSTPAGRGAALGLFAGKRGGGALGINQYTTRTLCVIKALHNKDTLHIIL